MKFLKTEKARICGRGRGAQRISCMILYDVHSYQVDINSRVPPWTRPAADLHTQIFVLLL